MLPIHWRKCYTLKYFMFNLEDSCAHWNGIFGCITDMICVWDLHKNKDLQILLWRLKQNHEWSLCYTYKMNSQHMFWEICNKKGSSCRGVVWLSNFNIISQQFCKRGLYPSYAAKSNNANYSLLLLKQSFLWILGSGGLGKVKEAVQQQHNLFSCSSH